MSEQTQEIANQSEESPVIERDAESEALFESFGLPQQKQETKEIEFPNMEEPTEPLTTEEESEEHHEEETNAEEKRTLKLKYNGEEKEVDEEEARSLAQKGMNYDKVQQRLNEQQKALDELAQIQGYKDHAELLANLPKLREQQQAKERAEHDRMIQDLRQQAEDAGLDPDQVQSYLDNHPKIKAAEKAMQERETERLEREQQAAQAETRRKWDTLYEKYPQLVESSKAFDDGKSPDWFNAEMQSRIQRGYDPVDAYELAHRDTITAQTRKATEQKIIKQQQLGLRGHVNEQTATPPDEASLLPVQVSLAEEFGVDLKGVQRQNQLLKSRR